MRFDALINGEGDSNTEGIVVRKAGDTVFFQFTGDGYIDIDDWGTLDPSRLINAIRDNTEKSNSMRREKDLSPLHVEGWLKEPTLDKTTKTVFWAISIRRDDGRRLANSVALRLGRSGYEKVIWAGNIATNEAGGVLDTILAAHRYDPGQRYEDHAAGDKLAGYGIAALVGAVAGAKLAKVAAAGGLLLLFKKFWFLVFAPLALLYRKLKSAFGAKPPAA